MVGTTWYVNLVSALTALGLPPTVATTSTTPVPGGLVTTHSVELVHSTFVAEADPNLNVVPPGAVLKPVPVTLTIVPPVVGPFGSSSEVMDWLPVPPPLPKANRTLGFSALIAELPTEA
jgi:hypothetical protein